MAVYELDVMAHEPPIQQIIQSAIKGTPADTLTFTSAMTRLIIKNTGSAALNFSVSGNTNLTDTLQVGEFFDDSFLEFTSVVMSGTTGSSYKMMVG